MIETRFQLTDENGLGRCLVSKQIVKTSLYRTFGLDEYLRATPPIRDRGSDVTQRRLLSYHGVYQCLWYRDRSLGFLSLTLSLSGGQSFKRRQIIDLIWPELTKNHKSSKKKSDLHVRTRESEVFSLFFNLFPYVFPLLVMIIVGKMVKIVENHEK